MARLKVLFADDQIPDESIPDVDLADALRRKYPREGPDSSFLNGFLPMRQAVRQLQNGYDVTVVNTFKDALRAIKKTHFDISIVDLRWDGDPDVLRSVSDNVGWKICDALEEADQGTAALPTFQIVCSSRFNSEPQIALLASQKGKLPVFKSYNEAGNLSLLATVNFIEKHLSNPSARTALALETARDFQQTARNHLSNTLAQEQQWSWLTLALVALSAILVLAGAAIAILGNSQVGVLTSICSLVTSAISTPLYLELRRRRENTKKALADYEKNYQDALKHLADGDRP